MADFLDDTQKPTGDTAFLIGVQTPKMEPGEAQDTEIPYKTARERLLMRFERDYWTTLLAECGGNVSEAARRAGVSRVHLYRMLKRSQLDR